MFLWAFWLGTCVVWGQTQESFSGRWALESWTVEPQHAPIAARLHEALFGRDAALSFGDDGEFRLDVGSESVVGNWQYIPSTRTLIFETTRAEALRAEVECTGERLCLTMRDGRTVLRVEWSKR